MMGIRALLTVCPQASVKVEGRQVASAIALSPLLATRPARLQVAHPALHLHLSPSNPGNSALKTRALKFGVESSVSQALSAKACGRVPIMLAEKPFTEGTKRGRVIHLMLGLCLLSFGPTEGLCEIVTIRQIRKQV